MLLLMIICGGGYYAWKTGLLEELGILPSENRPSRNPHAPVLNAEDSEQHQESVVRFSTIRNAAETMAYTAAISGRIGTSPLLKKLTHYRVVGSPTDAAVDLDHSRVCSKSPCDILFYGNPGQSTLEIRKGNKSKAVDLSKQTSSESIFIVLGNK